MNEFISSTPPPITAESSFMDPVITMIVATAFGVIVALLHLLAHRNRPTFRLWRTLLLISPLIAMATMAVGTNLAAAFTLFGTLAIVRFRTPIKEPLDAAFVIFSVVIGLATGNQSFVVAAVGTIVIAVTIGILLAFNNSGGKGSRAQLRLVLNSIDAAHDGWEGVLREHGVKHMIESCTIDRTLATQSLTLDVFGVDERKWPDLLKALMALSSIERASGRPTDE